MTNNADVGIERIRELLPEISRIEEAKLSDAVARIWLRAWRSSAWEELASVPKSVDLPAKRTLVTHTSAVARIAGHMVDVLAPAHGLTISKDRTLAIALLHDVSKVAEFEQSPSGARASRAGRLYQHGFLGAHWMEDEGLDEELVHGVLAHTPVSAVVPQTHEAVIVHYADFADSDVQLLDAGQRLFCKRRA
ncbi:HD domain-containing protein [Streptomyces yatensis]|uniref:HD domain-containing protein n=1 Tax=Streptomyces yatensis TaxID=155177 RepID=A0ABN2JJ20_9ACTN|nr:HD domain-containing protein [Streptomyces yatensis]